MVDRNARRLAIWKGPAPSPETWEDWRDVTECESGPWVPSWHFSPVPPGPPPHGCVKCNDWKLSWRGPSYGYNWTTVCGAWWTSDGLPRCACQHHEDDVAYG